jgi:serpin B
MLKLILIFLLINFISSLTISQSYNEFAIELYSKLSKTGMCVLLKRCNHDILSPLFILDENVFFSPYSIASSLSMCLLGARSKTELQMRELLNHDQYPANFNINDANAQLYNYLNLFKDSNLTLDIANKIYTKQGINVKKKFLDNIEKTFSSYLHPIDFTNPSFAANLINSWVALQTNNKIQNLVTSDMIDEKTAMILINAVYFKGSWLYSFDRNLTKKERFYLEEGTHKKVKMMHLINGYLKLKQNITGLNASICELPYIGNSISMSIILPNENVKLSEIEKVLDYNMINKIMSLEKVRTKVDLSIPKFKIEEEFEVSLNKKNFFA